MSNPADTGTSREGDLYAAPEALKLWKACATALKLNVETGEAL